MRRVKSRRPDHFSYKRAMALKRLFIALDPTEEIRSRIVGAIERCRSLSPGAKVSWSRAGSLHLTLKFLGPTDESLLPAIAKELSEAAKDSCDFEAEFVGAGSFPPGSRARVLWIGVEDPSGTLAALASSIGKSLAPLGFEPETRAFSPHLTIARIRNPRDAREALLALKSIEGEGFGSMTVRELILYESVPRREGTEYSVLSRFPITRRALRSPSSRALP